MNLDSLNKLYIHSLKDLYSAEKQILQALPKMIKSASAPELKKAFETHLKQTEEQVQRLEGLEKDLDKKLGGHKCVAMEGIIEEGKEVIEEDGDEAVRDAALIAAAQRVEHYEIAGYGCARTYARLLGFNEHADILQKTLEEEGETDKLLTQLAESMINERAAMA